MEEQFKEVLDGKKKLEELTLTPEQTVEFHQFAKKAAGDALGEVSGLRKEKQRLEEKNSELNGGGKPPVVETEAEKKLKAIREEQLKKAKDKFLNDHKLTDEEKAQLDAKFAKLDSGATDADLIYEDLLGSLGAIRSKTYVELQAEKDARIRAAEEAAAAEAGSKGGGAPGGGSDKKVSDEATKLSKDAGITPEAAQKVVTQGMKRVYN